MQPANSPIVVRMTSTTDVLIGVTTAATAGEVVFGAAIAIACMMIAVWAISLVMRDASIVDIAWGSGFVLVAWVSYWLSDGNSTRSLLLTVLTTIWGLRLAFYLAKRNLGHGEDFRYQSMRRKHGDRFAIVSLYTVFGLQGLLMFIVSLPVQLGQVREEPGFGIIGVLGVLVWGVGIYFEAVGDAQLARFKRNPANKGLIMDQGLWRYTRHPNYFGDSCVWWGLGLIAAESSLGIYGLIGPVVMTFLLVKVSGAAMLDRAMLKRKPGYENYVATTSGFIPRPPRR
jgi:steroid 5-alpha reductase family enzyme